MPHPNLLTDIDHLKQALAIAEQIEKLEAELVAVLGGSTLAASSPSSLPARKGSAGKRSPEVRAKMAAAQKARWAAKKTATLGVVSPVNMLSKPVKPKAKQKRKLSAEGRAKIIAALKARHAAAAAKKNGAASEAPAKTTLPSKAETKPKG